MKLAEVGYISADGVRWAERQFLRHPELPPAVCRAVSVLAQYANAKGRAWPSTATLAQRLRAGQRSINLHIASAVRAGLLRIITRRRGCTFQRIYELVDWSWLSPLKPTEADLFATEGAETDAEWTDDPVENPVENSVQTTPEQTAHGESLIHLTGNQRFTSRGISDSSHVQEKSQRREERAPAKNAAASPPPPASPRTPVVLNKGPAERTTVGDMVAAWNKAAVTSPLIALDRVLTRAEAIALQRAAKHPAISENRDAPAEAWRCYVRWCGEHPYMRGDRRGGHRGTLLQATANTLLDEWQDEQRRAAKPRGFWTTLRDFEIARGDKPRWVSYDDEFEEVADDDPVLRHLEMRIAEHAAAQAQAAQSQAGDD